MDSLLTPELALAYLNELSLDVRAGVVLDGRRRLLAGHPALAAPAGALLDVQAASGGLALPTTGGWVFAVRSREVGVVVAAGPLTLAGLMLHDVTEVVALLDGTPAQASPATAASASPAALQALAEAVEAAAPPVATLSSDDR